MWRMYWAHINYFTRDQFQTVIRRKYASLLHLQQVFYGELISGGCGNHIHKYVILLIYVCRIKSYLFWWAL
jgi:hypothetical protein